jgi:hypothetical protein
MIYDAAAKVDYDREMRLEDTIQLVKYNLSSASMDDMKMRFDRFEIQIIPDKDSLKISGVLASVLNHH